MAVEFQAVMVQCEAVSGRHFFLKSFDGGGLKLNDLVAFIADQVIVMLFVKHVIVNGFIIVEVALLADTDLAKEV